ncbi:MAG: NAD-dependent epimerase/dehydratase family protein [Solirubrobacterales bacterium]|nr:NAD-dependent epimerase/dehydratase family protein [Solirubrobacterales bacterium]
MRVFVAGATGAVGKRLVPALIEAGHEVTGMTRSPQRADAVRAAGAEAVIADALDRAAVIAAVSAARPEVVVHELTAIRAVLNPKRLDEEFAETNRLRTEGTDNLLAAAREAGARRLVAQSFGGWPYAREGGPVKSEDDPLDPHPPGPARRTLDAIRHLEAAVTEAEGVEGIVLRYGAFYGPGTSLGADGENTDLVRRRRFPIVAGGTGVWSLVHIDDAASATVVAIERGAPGIYNVCDDEPAPVNEWLPALAEAIGAKRPRRVPAWMARRPLGEFGFAWMTNVRGASNEKLRSELDWRPRWPSWRQGFRSGL